MKLVEIDRQSSLITDRCDCYNIMPMMSDLILCKYTTEWHFILEINY